MLAHSWTSLSFSLFYKNPSLISLAMAIISLVVSSSLSHLIYYRTWTIHLFVACACITNHEKMMQRGNIRRKKVEFQVSIYFCDLNDWHQEFVFFPLSLYILVLIKQQSCLKTFKYIYFVRLSRENPIWNRFINIGARERA